ncbi:MAG: hypothetical protein Q9173_000143 [Seirophora scorigena]
MAEVLPFSRWTRVDIVERGYLETWMKLLVSLKQPAGKVHGLANAHTNVFVKPRIGSTPDEAMDVRLG